MKKFIVFLCFFLSIGFVSISYGEITEREKLAIQSAEAFLKHIDEGKYAKGWQVSAKLFKDQVVQEKWDELMKLFREPLGKVTSRELFSQQYMTKIPSSPEGEYIVVVYQTNFENKPESYETVTPMLDKDGQWRVSGYYIK